MTSHDACTHEATPSARAACRRARAGGAPTPKATTGAPPKRRGLRKGEETTAERRVREAAERDKLDAPPNDPGDPDCEHSQVIRKYYDARRPSDAPPSQQVVTRVARYECQGEGCGKRSHVPYGSILSMTRLRGDVAAKEADE